MKRFMIMIAATLAIALCSGCGASNEDAKGTTDDTNSESGYSDTTTDNDAVVDGSTDVDDVTDDIAVDNVDTDTTAGDSLSDEDIQDVIDTYNSGSEIDWSIYTDEEKAAIQAAAAAEGVDVQFTADGGISVSDEDGTYQYGGEWPENEYTELVPKPEYGELFGASTTDTEFSVVITDITIDEMRVYTEKVKAAGFTIDAEVTDEEALGIAVYTYSATNSAGYSITIGSAMGINSITITKN